MFCYGCGAKLENGVKFCPECGTKALSVEACENAVISETPTLQAFAVPQPIKKIKKKGIGGMTICSYVLSLLALICIYFLRKNLLDVRRVDEIWSYSYYVFVPEDKQAYLIIAAVAILVVIFGLIIFDKVSSTKHKAFAVIVSVMVVVVCIVMSVYEKEMTNWNYDDYERFLHQHGY